LHGHGNKEAIYFIIIAIFDDSIGEYFWNNGDRYEGEWKDSKKHGKGKEGSLCIYD